MKKILPLFLALAMFFLAVPAIAATNIADGVIRATGMGEKTTNSPLGFRAATADAYRQLVEEINGVQITADTTVKNSVTADDTIRLKVVGFLKGARVIERKKDEQGRYYVTVEVKVYGENSLAEAVLPEGMLTPFLASSEFSKVTPTVKGDYTGVIIDCRGLDLQTAMAPGIFSQKGKLVYGREHFPHDFVIKHGYVAYSTGNSSTERAGDNPLIIKALSLKGKNVNPIISDDDARRIIDENTQSGFLAKGNVVFIK